MKNITRIALRTAGASLFALVATACTSITFHSQLLEVDHVPDSDTAFVEFTYRDFSAVNKHGKKLWGKPSIPEPDFERAMEFLQAVAEGTDVFIPLIPFIAIPVGDTLRDEDLTDDEAFFLRNIHVVEARVFEGAKGELMAFQRFEVPDLRVGVDLLNEAIRRLAFEIEESDSPFAGYTPAEVENLEIFLADAKAGFDWVQWNESGLKISIPVTATYLTSAIQDGLAELVREDDYEDVPSQVELLAGLLGAVREFRVEEKHVVLYIGNAEGDFSLDTSVALDVGLIPKSQDFRKELRDHVRNSDLKLPVTWKAEQ